MPKIHYTFFPVTSP